MNRFSALFLGLGAASPPPTRRPPPGSRGQLAAQALPFVFGALWLRALAGAFRG